MASQFIAINVEGWSVEEENMAQAAFMALLADNGVTHSGVVKRESGYVYTFEVRDPVGSLDFMNKTLVKNRISQIFAASNEAAEASQAEIESRKEAFEGSALKLKSIEDVEAWVNEAQSLDQLKLKVIELAKFVISSRDPE